MAGSKSVYNSIFPVSSLSFCANRDTGIVIHPPLFLSSFSEKLFLAKCNDTYMHIYVHIYTQTHTWSSSVLVSIELLVFLCVRLLIYVSLPIQNKAINEPLFMPQWVVPDAGMSDIIFPSKWSFSAYQ